MSQVCAFFFFEAFPYFPISWLIEDKVQLKLEFVAELGIRRSMKQIQNKKKLASELEEKYLANVLQNNASLDNSGSPIKWCFNSRYSSTQ